MKLNKITLLILAFVASLIVSLRAANFPAEIPTTRERQEYFAKQLVNDGDVGVQGDTISGTSMVTKAYTGPKGDLVAFAAMLKAQKLDYTVDPTKKVSSFVNYNYRNADGTREWNVFWGQKDWNYVKDASGWHLPSADVVNVDNVTFRQLPLEILGLTGAYVIYRDANGNQIGSFNFGEIGAVQGNFLILGNYLFQGNNGNIYINRNDGSLAIYGLDGKLLATSPFSHGVDSSVPAIRNLADNTIDVALNSTDDIVTVKYTAGMIVNVRFVNPISSLVRDVVVSEKKALDANPASAGTPLDPTKAMSFKANAGEEWVVIVERNSGKG